MARQSLRPQLNQIRAWVRQGRTDAWIAHQLGVSASQLRDFRQRHELSAEGEEAAADIDLRDEIEAEIEAELGEPEPEEEEEGYGIWLDPSIKDDPTYTEHWKGHKALRVTIEPDRIVLERVGDDADSDDADS